MVGGLRGRLPAHMQISEMLIREIMAGHLTEGSKLPPEREMAAGLKVAVGTLRRALHDLEARGLLERIQGSGNYIHAQQSHLGVYAFFRLELIEGAGLPNAEILSVDRQTKPDLLPRFGIAREAYRIRRLRRLGGKPAAIEEIWLDASRAQSLDAKSLSESLYLHYRYALGFSIVRVEDRVSAGAAPDWAPEIFAPRPGLVVGLIDRLAFAGDGASAEFSQTWFDPAMARYVARFQ